MAKNWSRNEKIALAAVLVPAAIACFQLLRKENPAGLTLSSAGAYSPVVNGNNNQIMIGNPSKSTEEPTSQSNKNLKDADSTAPTLSSLFKADAGHALTLSQDLPIWNKKTRKPHLLRTNLYLDFIGKVKYVGIYIPRSDEAYEICKDLPKLVPEILKDRAKSTHVSLQGFGNQTKQDELVFSGRVFLFHEDFFNHQQVADLYNAFKREKMAVEFRGPDFLSAQIAAWHREHEQNQK